MRTLALVIAIALGIVAAVGVRSYLTRQKREFQKKRREVNVAVAAKSIDAGEVLSRDMVRYATKPAELLTGLDVYPQNLERYLGRKVNRNIDRGTPILVSHFTSREPMRASRRLPEGMRAVSINVDAVSGVSGLINPGDSVDILATITETQPGARMSAAAIKTRRVLSNVTVLAVDDRMSHSEAIAARPRAYRRTYTTLTLLVTPLESELLIYLREHAKLAFTLRPGVEIGQKEELPAIDSTNVVQLAEEANRKRQEQAAKLEELPAPAP